jgi:plastocyanin
MKKLFNKLSTTQLLLLSVAGASLVGFGIAFAVAYFNNETSSKNSCAGVCVNLLQNEASPNTLAVTNGSYVQFNSADGKTHSLSIGGGGDEHNHKGKFSSGEFKADEAWKVQFTEDGTYTFHDHFNPKINVVVVVYTAGKQYEVE